MYSFYSLSMTTEQKPIDESCEMQLEVPGEIKSMELEFGTPIFKVKYNWNDLNMW